jgi:RHS repeat-associated protein
VPNASFEEAPHSVGNPPINHDLQAPPVTQLAIANGDFETGNFTSWSPSGVPTVQTSADRGYWARLAGSSDKITSSAIDVPTDAQSLAYDIGYLTTNNYSWVDVYVFSGVGYATATRVKRDYCSSCGYWTRNYLDLSPYRGQSIKVQFARYSGTSGIDNVSIQSAFPGFEAGGEFWRIASGGDSYAALGSQGALTSSPFVVDEASANVSVEMRGTSSSSQYEILVAPAPDFSAFTRVKIGYAPTGWGLVKFSLASYKGQQVKLRIKQIAGSVSVDDVGVQVAEVPGWTVSPNTVRLADGAGGTYLSSDSVTSDALTLPSDIQNMSFKIRAPQTTSFYVELLRGPNFATVTQLDYAMAPSSWSTLSYGLAPYAGEAVKIRVRRYSGAAVDLDDVGVFERVLPYWTPTTTDAIRTNTDGFGSYVTSATTGGAMSIASTWISPGILDKTSYGESRYFAVTYELGFADPSTLKVIWTNDAGDSWQVDGDAASSPTGVKTSYFPLHDFMGQRGRLSLQVGGGGRVYSIGDNIARQQLSEPFSRKVGSGIDTSTGAVAFPDQDIAVPGAIPLGFTRYYNSHSDRLGSLGYRWSHTYDMRLAFAGNDVGVVFGSGREEFFDGYSDGTYRAVDARVQSSLVKNSDGTYSYTTKDKLTYRFDAAGRLTRIEDLNANALTLAYDAQQRVASVTDVASRSLAFTYDGAGRVATVSDPAGAAHTYGYDAGGDLVSVTSPENGARHYSYDRHRLATVTDENGNAEIANVYDDAARLVSQTDAMGEALLVDYDTPAKGATKVTAPDGGQATFYFDAFQRTTNAVDPSGRVQTFLYDGNGNLDKVIDPAENAWDFAFDSSADLTSATDPLGNPLSFTYSASHLPTTVTDGRGNTTTLTYDGEGNMTSRTDALGRTWTYTYDAAGNKLTETNPLNETTTYTYDAAGNVTSKTDPLGREWTYAYSATGKVTSDTDPLGNTTSYVYDLLGRLILVRDPLLRDTSFLYDAVGNLLWAEDAAGGRTTWSYDDRGLVDSKTDPAGGVTTYSYDGNRNMTGVTDPLGNTTSYAFDSAGRLTGVTDPLGAVTAYTYDTAGRLATKTDPLGRTTSYAYDDAGRLSTTTLPNGASTNYVYDAAGNLISLADAGGHQTSYTYDTVNQLVASTDPRLQTTTYAYDPAGRKTSETDPLAHTTSYGYDAAGQLTSVTDPSSNTTSNVYDNAGRLKEVTDATNRTTTYGYDAAGQLTSVTDPGGFETTKSYDLAGRLAELVLPSGASTTYAYDGRGLLTSVTDPLLRTTSYGYDLAGRQTTETDALNHVTTFGYDAAGRRTSMTDALGGVVTFGFDAASQLTSLSDARGKTWSYAYNSLGLRTGVTDPLNRTTTLGYDAEGRLTTRTDARGVATTYGYDAGDDLASVSYPGGSTSFLYDAAGRRASMTDGTGTTSFGYDSAGRQTSVASPNGTLSYSYDGAGRRSSMSLPGSKTVDYAYDPAGRLGSITDWADRTTSFGYDDDGYRTSINRPNGVTTSIAYDPAHQVESIDHRKGSEAILGFSYGYDASGNRTSVTTSGGNESYTYDALHRLTQATYEDGTTVSYAYDSAGNRTGETRAGQTTTYSYDDAGQLLARGAKTYTYDANGNVLTAGTDSFAWDWNNRLSSADVGGHEAAYSYDGDDVRTGATVDGAEKDLLLDREGGLPTIVDDGTKSYLHADGLLSEVDGASVAYPLADALGSIRAETDPLGDVVGTASYDVFGGVRDSSGVGSLFGFTGEPTDATGLVHLRARDLDTETGRMLSVDTVQPNAPGTQGYNLYAYVANNPTNWADPTGHTAVAFADANVVGGLLAMMVAIPSISPGVFVGFVIVALVLACVLSDACMTRFQDAMEAIAALGSKVLGEDGPDVAEDPKDAPRSHPQVPSVEIPQASGKCRSAPQTADRSCGDSVVIGESSRRTATAAAAFGATTWPGPPPDSTHYETCAANEAWINAQIQRGAHIIDIGIDSSRQGSRSPYYALELRQIAEAGYPVDRRPWPASPSPYTPDDDGPCP